MGRIKGVCQVEGCNRPQTSIKNRGTTVKKPYYSTYCRLHRKKSNRYPHHQLKTNKLI